MRLEDDGATCRKRRGRIASSHGERQWEVARTEHGHGTDRNQHAADVWFRRRFTVRDGAVDTGAHPGAFTDKSREKLQLVHSAAALPNQPFGNGQRGFGVRRRQQFVTECFDLFRDRFQKNCTSFRGQPAKLFEGGLCRYKCPIDVGDCRFFELRCCAARRKVGGRRVGLGRRRFTRDDVLARKIHAPDASNKTDAAQGKMRLRAITFDILTPFDSIRSTDEERWSFDICVIWWPLQKNCISDALPFASTSASLP